MEKIIWWDMDGTVANLYSVDNWLSKLRNEDSSPYIEAEAIFNMIPILEKLEYLRSMGWKSGIISWTSKESSYAYYKAVVEAKIKWLKCNFNFNFDYINIVPYGVPKSYFMRGMDILFDDDARVRQEWINHNGIAYNPVSCEYILKILSSL